MAEWTPARVEDRLRKAVALKTSLPKSDQALPDTSRAEHADVLAPSGGEGIGTIGGIGVDALDTADDDVVRMATEALSWLRWLDPEDAGIVLARLEGARWKLICWRFGISRPTADRRWRCALALIAWRLNGHSSSARPSMRTFLNRTRPVAGCETFLVGTGMASGD